MWEWGHKIFQWNYVSSYLEYCTFPYAQRYTHKARKEWGITLQKLKQ